MNGKTDFLQISPLDTAAVALRDVQRGESVQINGTAYTVNDPIAFGHKIALCDIKPGEDVIKYGHPIGHATAAIPALSLIHILWMLTNLIYLKYSLGSQLMS